jgi:hypothetical protein
LVVGTDLGVMERAVLRSVRGFGVRGVPAARGAVADCLFGPAASGWGRDEWRNRLSSFHRAVRFLKGNGNRPVLLREVEWTGVLKLTGDGEKALDALEERGWVPGLDGGGSLRADLDLVEVRRQRRRGAAGQGLRPGGFPAGVRTGRGAG